MDYSNLGQRAKGAKERMEQERLPLDVGTYKCVIRSGEFGKSRAGNDMFTLNMKVRDDSASERMQGETLKIRFVITPNTEHQLDQFLSIMNDWGADLSKVKKDSHWTNIFDDLEEARAKAVIEVVKDEKNDKYYNFNWLEVIRCLNLDGTEEDDDEPEPKKPAKKKAAPKKKTTPPPEPEDDGEEDDDDDW